MTLFLLLAAIILVILLVLLLGPRPRLRPDAPASRVPASLAGAELGAWLDNSEAAVANLVPGTGAHIQWADPHSKSTTALSFLYLHGFSASHRETAPVTAQLAQRFGGNVVQARLAGHGTGPDGMLAPAEDWLQSVIDSFDIAARIGERVVIVATSTGATLATWLALQDLPTVTRIHALLFMSPNFKVRSSVAWLLTAPWARQLLPKLMPSRSWEPENAEVARYWTHSYSIHAVIEMQKVVDWVAKQPLASINVPVATMVMANDPTIDSAAAIAAHHHFSHPDNQLIDITIAPDEPVHVFTGDITGATRTAWTIDAFAAFLAHLEAHA